MNRRGLFRLFAGAAAAVGLRKVPAPKQVIAPLTDFPGTPFAATDAVYEPEIISVIFPSVASGWKVACAQQYINEARNGSITVEFLEPCTPRPRILSACAASRDARMASRFVTAKA